MAKSREITDNRAMVVDMDMRLETNDKREQINEKIFS